MPSLPTLGRYELAAELGKGAMGVVYKARDPMLDRIVAIKTINMAEAEQDGLAEYEARLIQEARAAGGLNHPNIVIVHDIGKSGSLVYMAMEYIEGGELRELLGAGQPLAPGKALDIAAQVADGLAYAHEHHVIHRDIKPANIMITPQGRAKIADFGIARMRTAETRTQTGVILGSPKYLSPEQVLGQRADGRSDIFSLGVILYHMLTGATPFNGESVSALMYNITNHEPPPPGTINAQVPVMLDYIVAKALAKAPESRYQSAAELAADLRECARRIETGQQASTGTLNNLAPNADAGAAPAGPPVARTRDNDAGITPEPAPTRGLSQAFDSLEATARLARESGATDDFAQSVARAIELATGAAARDSARSATRTVPLAVTSVSPQPTAAAGAPPSFATRASVRSWGSRETGIFAATVAAALAIAAAIVLL